MKTNNNVVVVYRQLYLKAKTSSIITSNGNDTVVGNVNVSVPSSDSLYMGLQIEFLLFLTSTPTELV